MQGLRMHGPRFSTRVRRASLTQRGWLCLWSLLMLVGPIVAQRGLLLHAHDGVDEHVHLLPASLGAADHHAGLHDWHQHEHEHQHQHQRDDEHAHQHAPASSDSPAHPEQETWTASGALVRLADAVPHARPASLQVAVVLSQGLSTVIAPGHAPEARRIDRPPGVPGPGHVLECRQQSAIAVLLRTSHAILI